MKATATSTAPGSRGNAALSSTFGPMGVGKFLFDALFATGGAGETDEQHLPLDNGYRGEDAVATLDRACRKIGYPKTMRVGNFILIPSKGAACSSRGAWICGFTSAV